MATLLELQAKIGKTQTPRAQAQVSMTEEDVIRRLEKTWDRAVERSYQNGDGGPAGATSFLGSHHENDPVVMEAHYKEVEKFRQDWLKKSLRAWRSAKDRGPAFFKRRIGHAY